MKKIIAISLLSILLFAGCGKYCSCKNPDTSAVQEIEINYDEDCNNYSSSSRGDCM